MATNSKVMQNHWKISSTIYHWNVWDDRESRLVVRVYEEIPGFDIPQDNA